MRAYLINPEVKEITEVDYTGNYKNIYEHIQADMFEGIPVEATGDTIFVDEEGLLKPQEHFFKLSTYHQPVAGRGLVLGLEPESGDSCEPKCTIEYLEENIAFMSLADVRGQVQKEARNIA